MRGDPVAEVIDVQSTDDLEAGEPFSSRPTSPWRRVLGTAVAVVLVVAGAFSVISHTTHSSSRPATADDERVVGSARAALDAWSRFGTTGDLNVVLPHFDKGGPQFALLADESHAIAPRPPGPPSYTFTLSDAHVLAGAAPDERIVRGEVIAARANESDQQFQWDLVLHRGSENRWLLWTVRDRRSNASPGAGGPDLAR
jgi:hypothetical protein